MSPQHLITGICMLYNYYNLSFSLYYTMSVPVSMEGDKYLYLYLAVSTNCYLL